jgi:hypothetical protein
MSKYLVGFERLYTTIPDIMCERAILCEVEQRNVACVDFIERKQQEIASHKKTYHFQRVKICLLPFETITKTTV